MTSHHSRFSSFSSFGCSNDGEAFRRRIHAMARHHVSGHAAKIDPNWHSVDICFDHHERVDHDDADASLTDACRVEFGYRPTSVTLVGPKVGEVSLTNEIFRIIPEPLVMLMRTCDVLQDWHHTLSNPRHVIELVDGKTVIRFENCVSGVVRNVRGDSFDVESLGLEDRLDEDQKHYTRERLLREFKIDAYRGEAVDVSYFPFLPKEGMTLNTVEEYREMCRIQHERYETERPQREAEVAARRAAEEAVWTPEQRARHERLRQRAAAQAGIIRGLLPVLPQPE